MAPLTALAGRPASYLSEADYFQDNWQASFWGHHYPRLTQVKHRYDHRHTTRSQRQVHHRS